MMIIKECFFLKKFSLLLITLLLFNSQVSADEIYDPQNTISALNMAAASVHKILSAKDKITLELEYNNIINNLRIGNIKSDTEIMKLYEKLLDVTSRKKLRTQESEIIRKNYDEKSKRSISSALKELGKNPAFLGNIVNLISVSTAAYFSYQYEGKNLSINLDEKLYQLKTDDLSDFHDLQKQLLSSSWKLMNKYHIPDDYRLLQSSLDDLYKALNESDLPSQKLRMLQAIESDFLVYPPYWYYRAKAAQDNEDFVEAENCYDKFEEVWRPVLRRDPYMLECAKYRINEIIKSGLPYDADTKNDILDLCLIMRENTMRDDWVNNIFAGALYYALGEIDTGIKCIEMNLDFSYEHELSNAILSQMYNDIPADLVFYEAVRLLKLNELTENLSSDDKKLVFTIADFLDNKNIDLNHDNQVILHASRLNALINNNTDFFDELINITGNMNFQSRDYEVVMPLLNDYADDDNERAKIFLADIYLYVSKDIELAKKYYLESSKNMLYPQIMYIHLITSNHETLSQDTIIKTKTKKPFIRFWPFK